MEIEIRQEKPEDYTLVYQVNEKAFGQDSEAKLVEALRKNKEVFVPELSLIALYKEQVIGHILFTKINILKTDNQFQESLALAPMAVLPQMQLKGIGSSLIKEGLKKARDLGFTSVIVLGHPDYYPKFGFIPASDYNIKTTFEVPENAFMAIELTKGALKENAGTVCYPKEFENVS